jgi:hypothetical protein
MSDAGDLVALLGELDRTIGQLDGETAATARAAAATMVPPLGEPDAAGWYDRLVAVTHGELGPRSLSEAMTAIAAPAEGFSALPRRFAAIVAVARALPSRFGPDGSEADLTLRALSTPGILASAPPLDESRPPPDETSIVDEARVLLPRLLDPVELPNVGVYRDFVGRESNRALFQDALLRLPAPCTTDVVEVTADGQAGRALSLVTNVCVTGVDLADIAAATGFLNPANWDGYPGWCGMIADPRPPNHTGPARYLEIVALDCPSGALKVAVWLDFSPLVQRPKALVRTYRMSASQGGGTSIGAGAAAAVHTANDAVIVDEGSLKVIDEGTHLRVKTTKRVRFRAGLDVTILRIIACCAGYGALAAEFVAAGTGGSARDVACAPAGGKATLAGDEADPLKERVEALGQSIDECATALKSSISKAASGAYAADDFTEDVVGAVGRSTQAWLRVADLVAAVARPSLPDDEVVSDRFVLEPAPTGPCTLALAGPLLAHNDVAPVPLDCVRLDPEALAAGADGFELVVQPRGLRGTTYFGVVNVTDATTAQVRQVNVDVQVP